jgi:hypothetical protein
MRHALADRTEPEKSEWSQPIVDIAELTKWADEQMEYLKVSTLAKSLPVFIS